MKDWFFDWAGLQKRRHGWSGVQTLRAAKELAPELLARVHEDVPRKWKLAKVPVAAPVMREIFNQQLERWGVAPIKSNQWV